jgi:hypothetical protein
MQVSRFDHNTDIALADGRVSALVSNITRVLQATPVPFWPNKSEKQTTKCILQPVLNAHISQELIALGAGEELKVTGDSDSQDGMRVDFYWPIDDKLVAVEVQFGNVGRVYGDLWKFLHLEASGQLALAISVSLTDATAQLTDSGISTHENTVKRICEVQRSTFSRIPVPLLCLGLSHEGTDLLDFSRSQFEGPRVLEGTGAKANIHHAVRQLREGTVLEDVGPLAVARERSKASVPAQQAGLF